MAGFEDIPKNNQEEKKPQEATNEEVDTSYLDLVEGKVTQPDSNLAQEQIVRQEEDNAKADELLAKIKSGEVENTTQPESSIETDSLPAVESYKNLKAQYDANRRFDLGRMQYLALAGDKETFTQDYNERRETDLALADAYEQALEEYHKAGGEGIPENLKGRGMTREETLHFQQNQMASAEEAFKHHKEKLAIPLAERKGVVVASDISASSTFGYSQALLAKVLEVAKNQPEHNSPENRKRNLDEYFSKQAQGFGLAALEAGDLVSAAQALAVADTIGIIPGEIRGKITDAIKNLGENEKAKFAELMAREKSELKPKLERYIS